jgi:hypothetical protein
VRPFSTGRNRKVPKRLRVTVYSEEGPRVRIRFPSPPSLFSEDRRGDFIIQRFNFRGWGQSPRPTFASALLGMLRSRADAFEKAEDDRERLQVALESFRHVLLYLRADPEITNGPTIRPLEFLRVKASDIERGAKPFDFKPDGAGTKPSGTQHEYIQGMLAYAFEALISSDIRKDEALRWLTTEIRRAGVRTENDCPISAVQIRRWRDDIRRRNKPNATRGAPNGGVHPVRAIQTEIFPRTALA